MYTLVLTEQGEAFAQELRKVVKHTMRLYPSQEYRASLEWWTVGDDILHTIALAYDHHPVQAVSGSFKDQCDAVVQRMQNLELSESELAIRVGFHLCCQAGLILMLADRLPLFSEAEPVLKALGSPARLSLLGHLHVLGREATVAQLVDSMQITKAAVYTHLKVLKAACIVTPSQYQARTYTICTLTLEALAYVLMHAW